MTRKATSGALNAGSLGQRLREVRESLGSSQAEMANAAGVPRDSYSKYERDITSPGPEALVRLSRAGGVRSEWLVTGEGPKTDDETWPRVQSPAAPYVADGHLGESVDAFFARGALRSLMELLESAGAHKLTAADKARVIDNAWRLYRAMRTEDREAGWPKIQSAVLEIYLRGKQPKK